ncbi:TonB-dependent receptor [uncultured Draconibacterium sp.]|uniref:SusC/RagA family TonB-linked outer membrane protein n=1 Tax=uncultured Draconibacterium sp. TaxID=1573823 RepID=UPI0025E7FAF5|nr:TonB-dependent receptor [uncultured Draconibacterium sp.]
MKNHRNWAFLPMHGKTLRFLFALALCTLVTMSVFSQTRPISGMVTDSNGEPLPGVTVVVKETTIGITTDFEGNYLLQVPADAKILSFSFVGMKTQEIEIGSQTQINVVLEEETIGLDEVVAIGYGVQKKSNVTGAISSVKGEELASTLGSNAASAIQGRVSGVQVVNNSGAPGATPTLRVRGYSSNGSSDPLYIVDGLKVSDISYLEPSSIESMEVLKDAASAAIYGAEAGNGVILITTKSGSQGQTKVIVDAQWSFSNLANKVDLLDAEQYSQFYTEAFGDVFTSLYNEHYITGTDTDWQDEMYETGLMQKYNLSLQGGNKSGKFFISLGYMDNDGMVRLDRDYYKRFTGQINSSYNIKPWLEVGSNNTITSVNSSTLSENNVQYGMMKDIVLADPLTPVFYDSNNLPSRVQTVIANGLHPITSDDGNYYGYSWARDGLNPLAAVQTSNTANKTFSVNGMTYANIKPFKNFVFTSRLGYTLGNVANQEYNPTRWDGYFKDVDAPLVLKSQQVAARYYQWENFINYMLETEQAGNFSIMAGTSYINKEYNIVGAQTNELSSEEDNFVYLNYSTTSANDFVTGNLSYQRQIAYYGRLSWDYMNRYNVQANFRADSYDAAYLDLDHNWGYFPSLSAGWTFSNENFMENIKGNFFTYGKLRASYGINGSISNLGNYMYAATLRTGQYDLEGNTANMAYWLDDQLYRGTYPNSVLANPELRWERSKQQNYGLDLRFMNDRLSTTIEYYYKLTDGLLVQSVAPLVTGAETVFQNLGEVTNSGLELELTWKDKIGDFSYEVRGSFATVNNNVKKYRGEGIRIQGSRMLAASSYTTFFEEGYPLWYIRGYKLDGVDATTGAPVFADLTGEGEITEADRTDLGNAIPDYTYGLTLSASYKNFDVSIYGTGTSGNSMVYAMMSTAGNEQSNRPAFLYENRWTSSNSQASLPSPLYQMNDPRFYNSDAFVFDASFFKIKQIQLGYKLPKKLMDPIGMESVRAYVQLDNFFTFTDYPGSDPETNAYNSAMALDFGSYPIAKSVSFGFNITF